MRPSGGDVGAFLLDVTPARRRADAEALVDLMREVSGREPVLWGTMVGFGACHYVYPTGTEGDMPVLAFAPRRQATTIYLESTDAHAEALSRLGPHTTGRGCLYIKSLEDIDVDVLRDILTRSLAWTEAGGTDQMTITVTG
ncbi:DUF1801 domain-containing protein [Microbacterium rhizophilus]|uniref:DUF1801 domain-containing protein n=1 Tax=Microbacterium rhizophilus TaxID=3138934 RepID=UPI0031EF5774